MINKILSDPSLLMTAIAVGISFISILLTVFSLRIQRIHNRKTLKPIGNIIFADYEDKIAVNIKNTGVGPLIIKELKVSDNSGKSKINIIEWMPSHPDSILWTNFFEDATGFVIPPGESLNIIELSTKDNISNSFAEFRDQVRTALSNLIVELTYKDIYDKKMPVNSGNLKWFGRNVK